MNILGIDPGQKGGLAVVDGAIGGMPFAIKMPETRKDICEMIQGWKTSILCAYIEDVHAMPKQGVSSTFKFGRNLGTLEGILAALDIPMEHVTPQKWQQALGCLSKGNKNVTKAKAQELYPSLKITHNVADALLIATYGYRIQKGRS